MGNKESLRNKLNKALKILNKFKEYCLQLNIEISDFKVLIWGVTKPPIPFTEDNIYDIARYAGGYEHKITFKFKSSEPLTTRNGLEYAYQSYQIPMKKLSITVLKNSIEEKYKQRGNFISEIEKWAKSNKVYFHRYYDKKKLGTDLDCAVLVSGDNISYGFGVGKIGDKFKIDIWEGYDSQEKKEVNSLKEVIDCLNKWVNTSNVKEAKMSKAKAFAFKDRIVYASTRSQAVKVLASVNLLDELSLKSQAEQEMMVLNALANLRGVNLEQVFTNINIQKLKNLIEKYPEFEKKLPSRLKRLCKYNSIVTQD